eukprot:s1568_g17.t1
MISLREKRIMIELLKLLKCQPKIFPADSSRHVHFVSHCFADFSCAVLWVSPPYFSLLISFACDSANNGQSHARLMIIFQRLRKQGLRLSS